MEENTLKKEFGKKGKIQKWILVVLILGIGIFCLFDFVTGRSRSVGDSVPEYHNQ